MGTRAVAVAASACLVATLVVACGAGPARAPGDTSSPTVAAVQLSAAAVYGRHAAVRGKVDVRLTNEGDRAVDVVSYQVRHPLYEQVPATQRDSRVAPGATVLRPVDFGAPRCSVTDPAGAVVVVGVRGEDGVAPVAVPLPDEGPGLVRAHEVACAAEAAVAEAAPAFGETWTVEAGGLASTLVLRRPGGDTSRRTGGDAGGDAGDAVAVTAVGGSILFSVEPQRPWPLTLPGGEVSAEMPVLLTVARCDPHALIESKTSFTFPVSVQVGDSGPPVPVKVTVGDEGREALQALLDSDCGLAPGG